MYSETEIREARDLALRLVKNSSQYLIGLEHILFKLLVALLSKVPFSFKGDDPDGRFGNAHVLLRGVPGTGKTILAESIGGSIGVPFGRIQGTPDLKPIDLTGFQIFDQETKEWKLQKGPILKSVILLWDEINRTPPKTQSAALEAFQERQVTIDNETHKLPSLFWGIATLNPIEEGGTGTYELPEAQVDRFTFELPLKHLSREDEIRLLRLDFRDVKIQKILNIEDILRIKEIISTTVYVDPKIDEYIASLVVASRPSQTHISMVRDFVQSEKGGRKEFSEDSEEEFSGGLSSRASLHLRSVVQTHAFLNDRGYVLPSDVKELFPDLARHRIILNERARNRVTANGIVGVILSRVAIP